MIKVTQFLSDTIARMNAAQFVFLASHFSLGKTYVHRGKRVALILNPKVGSTSVREIFRSMRAELPETEAHLKGQFRFLKNARSLPMASLPDYYDAISNSRRYHFYTFVRNPYKRLKSAWEDKLGYGHESAYPRSIRGRRLSAVRALCREHGLPGGAPNTAVPFPSFLALLESGDKRMSNHHWDRQVDVLLTDRLDYHRFFKIETEFVEGMKILFAELDLPPAAYRFIDIPRRNESVKRAGAVYDETLAARVHRLFEADFALFGYDPQSWCGV
jgi:hypothetical protein